MATARAFQQLVARRVIDSVRLTAPDPDGTTVDLLFASCGVEREIVAAAEVTEIAPGLSVPVARPGHLIAMKLLAGDDRRRPLDLDDLRSLAETADDEDRAMAEEAVRLIERRGFSRGRDLTAALSLLREGWRES
jgi:predicted nucleotidyltransferase